MFDIPPGTSPVLAQEYLLKLTIWLALILLSQEIGEEAAVALYGEDHDLSEDQIKDLGKYVILDRSGVIEGSKAHARQP